MPKAYVLRNASTGVAIATQVGRADGPISRGIGLLTRATVAPHEGLWIDGCSAVHTLGMRATLDLYFLDRGGCVVRIAPAIPPHRLSVACRGARSVVELGAGGGERPVHVGDRLVLE